MQPVLRLIWANTQKWGNEKCMQRRHSIFRKAKKSQNILWAPAGGLIFHLPWIRCQSAIILTNATNAANLNIYSPSHQADMGKHENKHWRNEKCTDCNHNCYSDSSHIQATFENPHSRDQREWVFKDREVKSENKKLSLFFEKCKVKKNAFTLFREVKSEIKMLRDRDREVKILENS